MTAMPTLPVLIPLEVLIVPVTLDTVEMELSVKVRRDVDESYMLRISYRGCVV